MAHCSWICWTFCFLAGCSIILNVGYATAAAGAPATTTEPTSSNDTSNDTTVEYVGYRQLSSKKRSGIVTIEYHFEQPANQTVNKTENQTDANEVIAVHRLTKIVVTEILNAKERDRVSAGGPGDNSTAAGKNGTVTPGGSTPAPDEASGRRRRRRAAADSHNVELVAVDPPVKDGRLRTAVVASDPDGKVLPAAELESDLHDNEQQISDETGYPVADIYVGLPPDVRPLVLVDDRPSIWDKHFWLFVIVGILLVVAIITALICCICFYCCRKTKRNEKQPPPLLKKAPVEEKIELTRVAPVQQSAPPSSSRPPMKEQPTTTAPPSPPHSDDENGWIIPLDQLSQDELDQPDVQISRL